MAQAVPTAFFLFLPHSLGLLTQPLLCGLGRGVAHHCVGQIRPQPVIGQFLLRDRTVSVGIDLAEQRLAISLIIRRRDLAL